MKSVIFLFGIAGALLFIIASILGGLQIEGYSFVSQFISESYANGIPNTEYLRHMYMVCGFLLALFGFMVPQVVQPAKYLTVSFYLFAIFYGIGTISTGFFPCDLGCPSNPEKSSISQIIHNASGFLVYAIVPFCLLGIGVFSKKWKRRSKFSKVSIICGTTAFCFVVLLFGNPKGPFVGLFQRLIEGSILFWVMYTAFFIRTIKNKIDE